MKREKQKQEYEPELPQRHLRRSKRRPTFLLLFGNIEWIVDSEDARFELTFRQSLCHRNCVRRFDAQRCIVNAIDEVVGHNAGARSENVMVAFRKLV